MTEQSQTKRFGNPETPFAEIWRARRDGPSWKGKVWISSLYGLAY